MAFLSNLPIEVVVLIAEACRVPEKSALVRTNRQLNELLTPVLYRYNIQREGSSAMFWAAEQGCIKTFDRLLSHGAEVNDNHASRFLVVHKHFYPYRPRRLHDTFFTPLHIAAKFGQDDAVKWLLNHGARIEAVAHNLCGCQDGATDIANDTDFDPRLSPLSTPLHIAICNGQLTTAKLLVSRGAELDVGVATPLHTAARFNNAEAVDFLLKNELADVDQSDNHGYAPLHLACMTFQDVSAMEKLFEFDADLEVNADDGRTPLAFACERGYFRAALRLLDQGADHEVEWDGQTPIQVAAMSMTSFFPRRPPSESDTWEDERELLVRRLLELGVDVDEAGGLGTTALHIAAAGQSLSRTLRLFLDAGADVNATDDMQQTPLHVAFESGHLASVAIKIVPLLQRGGRLDKKCMRGRCALDSALEAARLRGDYSIIDLIFQHASTANFSPGFLDLVAMSSYYQGLYDECRVLIRHGATVDISGYELRDEIRTGINARDLSKIQFVLDIIPDPVTSCRALYTALESYDVVKDEEMAIITALLDRPDMIANGHRFDDDSPLHVACRKHHNLDIIQRLLNGASEVNLFNADYETPLSYAVGHRCPHTVRLLLRHGANPFMSPSEEDWRSYVELNEFKLYGAGFVSRDLDDYNHLSAFYGAIEPRPMHVRCVDNPSCHHSGNPHLLEIMLEYHSLPPLPSDPSSQSYVHVALCSSDALGILLKKGADPNAGGHCDQPPLLDAVNPSYPCDRVAIVGMLLRSGADINQRNEGGVSFLGFFKNMLTAISEITDEDAEFKNKKLEVAGMLARNFRLVVSDDSGEVRITARPADEAKAFCRDFMRRKWEYRQKIMKKEEY